jgi:predicted amidohydrolase
MKLNVALLQFRPELAETAKNLEKVRLMLENVQDADLVVIPELANSGYNFRSPAEAVETSETIKDGDFSAMLIEDAKKKNRYIVSGVNERDGDRLYNTALLAGPGGYIGKYRKIHLFVDEKDFFEAGDLGLPVFDLDGFKLGIQICFDYLFADAWRILAQKGANLVCHPSNLITENAYRALPGQALMNRIFIATANRTGTEGELTFCGQSIIFAPDGSTLLKTPREGEHIAQCEIDITLSHDKMITRRNHVFEDRRTDLYH